MTIERAGNERWIACDDCGEATEAYDHKDFHALIEAAKDSGWTIIHDRPGVYIHKCPSCPPASPLEQARRLFSR